MSNILNAIENIIKSKEFQVKREKKVKNQMNEMGSPLEEYVKDAFANTFNLENLERSSKIGDTFSYLGNDSNPPDIMLRGDDGDAIEVKKIETNSTLQLNSSQPKYKLYCDDSRITKECKKLLNNKDRDIIYCVGLMKNKDIKGLSFVYGLTYCAKKEVYYNINKIVEGAINSIRDQLVVLDNGTEMDIETNELGRINRIDPLLITSLRIRGMYLIKNPFQLYNVEFPRAKAKQKQKFILYALIPIEKFNKFENHMEFQVFANEIDELEIHNREVQDPSNPNNKIICKEIVYRVNEIIK